MSDLQKSTRIGDILVERGTITRQQLLKAIDIQQTRRLFQSSERGSDPLPSELGEVLIELGFINRQQLTSTLSWQQRLRKATLVMTFVAPLLTVACGGGGGGGGGTPVAGNNKIEAQSSISSVIVSQAAPDGDLASSTSSISTSSISSEQLSSKSSKSSKSLSSSSAIAVVPASAEVNGPVIMYWTVPTKRENGTYLDITEIGGYELRYKLKNESTFVSVNINSGYTDSYYFDHLEGDFEFQIAAYDVNGLYSEFVPINPS